MYERFGFFPLDTPILENACVFDGHHGEGEEIIFHLRDKDSNPLVLRYDLTVPLARVVSTHKLARPFRRYQIGPVFRDEANDGRHCRQFIQCDGDVVGCQSSVLDAEIVSLAFHGLKDLGFADFTIRINHRKIFQGIARTLDINDDEQVVRIQRALDKSDKKTRNGIDGIKENLSLCGLDEDASQVFIEAIEFSGTPAQALDYLEGVVGGQKVGLEGVLDLREIISCLPDDIISHVEIDISLARGADYYTGFILEGVIKDTSVGAVLGGGRYDDLIRAFTGQKSEPAVGMAFGFERIFVAMKELGILGMLDIKPSMVMVGHTSQAFSRYLLRVSDFLRRTSFEVLTWYEPASESNLLQIAANQGCNVLVTICSLLDPPIIKSVFDDEDNKIVKSVKNVLHRN